MRKDFAWIAGSWVLGILVGAVGGGVANAAFRNGSRAREFDPVHLRYQKRQDIVSALDWGTPEYLTRYRKIGQTPMVLSGRYRTPPDDWITILSGRATVRGLTLDWDTTLPDEETLWQIEKELLGNLANLTRAEQASFASAVTSSEVRNDHLPISVMVDKEGGIHILFKGDSPQIDQLLSDLEGLYMKRNQAIEDALARIGAKE